MLKVLDLFSGIGGMSLGLSMAGGFKTVAFCEIEAYPRAVLNKNFPGVPVYGDIRKLNADRLIRDGVETPDIISGGYPCQPFSTAGLRRGANDDRHLWPEMARLIAEIRPAWVLCENVAGHVSMGLDNVLSALETENYAAQAFIIPALAVGAKHIRNRVWIVANAGSKRRQQNAGGTYGNESANERRRPENLHVFNSYGEKEWRRDYGRRPARTMPKSAAQ